MDEALTETAERTERKVFAVAGKIIRPFNPFIDDLPQEEKAIRLLVLFFGSLALESVTKSWRAVKGLFSGFSPSPVIDVFFLFTFLLFPVSIILFWLKKPAGFTLFVMYLVINATLVITGAVWSVGENPYSYTFLESVFSVIHYLFSIAYYVISLYIISRPAIRSVCGISNSRMHGDMAMSAMLAIIMWTISYRIISSS